MADNQPNPVNTASSGAAAEKTLPAGGMEVHARRLATGHQDARPVTARLPAGVPLVARTLPWYRTTFTQAVQRFRSSSGVVTADPVSAGAELQPTTPLPLSFAAEWVLDNDFLAITALRQVDQDLPVRYDLELPRLVSGPLAGYARIYVIARELVLMSAAHLDPKQIERFVDAYQVLTPLTMGELWALPALLRFTILQALIEATTRLTLANAGAKQLKELPFPLLQWPEGPAGGDGGAGDGGVGDDSVGDDAIVAGCFISLRALAAEDWKEFFEKVSQVERLLSHDPAGVYSNMDFETRDRYRKVVEAIALRTGIPELNVARQAIQMAQEAVDNPPVALPAPLPVHDNGDLPSLAFDRRAHVGYYLIDRGRSLLEEYTGFHPTGGERLKRWISNHPAGSFLSVVAVLTVLLLAGMAAWMIRAGAGAGSLALGLLLGLVLVLTIAVQWANWLVTHLFKPRVLPKLDFSTGIPEGAATLVAVPCMLTGQQEVESLINQLEQHYLRNPDPQLAFALVSDFTDADQEQMPGDEALIKAAAAGVEELARKYRRPFLLLHRARRWNPAEGAKGLWMGWERKRGKLHELNHLILAARKEAALRQDGDGSAGDGPAGVSPVGFAFQAGEVSALAGVRYVITLDADTVLPPGEARRLVATLAHPLNRAELITRPGSQDAITAGYSILQPRTKISPTSSVRSYFTRIFSGDTGLDLYTLAVSDVYQDLFGEGIYVGKGIYDVEAFERSLAGRVPENTLLSHDLFEGLFGRTALVSDSVLIEDYPSHYLVHTGRMKRWIRGDWQLLPWLSPRVPQAAGGTRPNPLELIDRWKIIDNLRRSAMQPALFALLAAIWLGAIPGSPVAWTLAALVVLAMPLLTELAAALSRLFGALLSAGDEGRDANWRAWRSAVQSLRTSALRWLLAVVFLPYEAWLTLGAIVVTLIRMGLTHRNLLRWTTAAQTERRFGDGSGLDRAGVWAQMIVSPLAAGLLWLLIAVFRSWPQALAFLPLAAAWILAPEVALRVSRPIQVQPPPLPARDQQALRTLARRTWLFFEQFVGPEDHWLPPDHFQEAPLGRVAHRTSPTNIGLNLLSILGAYDLGYIGLLGLVARLRSSFDTLAGLERYRGHFLNWYDTRTLEPLYPRYVSTVDSGNLAACLVALRQGLLELKDAPFLRWETLTGLVDALSLLEEPLRSFAQADNSPADAVGVTKKVLDILSEIRLGITSAAGGPQEWAGWLLELRRPLWDELDRSLLDLVEEHAVDLDTNNLQRLRLYIRLARQRLENARREVELLGPWLPTLTQEEPPAYFARSETLQAAWTDLQNALLGSEFWKNAIPSLESLSHRLEESLRQAADTALPALPEIQAEGEAARTWLKKLADEVNSGMMAAKTLQIGFQELANQAETLVSEMDFSFLFHTERQVFRIGYNLAVDRLDENYYDLLASEARIASLVAIAWGQVPASHWLHLARPITEIDGVQVLLSWSATMFEYLMPGLLQRQDPGTLLSSSAHAATGVQIAYGARHGVPWGISESGFYRFDANMAYQYRAFGVPDLGYKRGLADDLVITPYASLLALSLRPQAVAQNLAYLEKLGGVGAYGLYEALDFGTLNKSGPARLPLGSRYEVVREYMAHHQGMIFLSLVNYFLSDRMVRRFHADPRIRSVELLLQEQIPRDAPIQQPHTTDSDYQPALRSDQAASAVNLNPWRVRVNAPQPRLHFLSNGRLGTLITASGGGYSAGRDLDLTRFRADATLSGWGTWIYIQDVTSGRFWSAGHEPVAAPAGGILPDEPPSPSARTSYPGEVVFYPHTAAFTRRDGDITTAMNLVISPDADVEVRMVTLTNHGDVTRRLRLCSYAEVVLGSAAADRRHPAFSKLFVESEWVPASRSLLFRRRPRSEEEEVIYLAHSLILEDGERKPDTGITNAGIFFETDRERFLGRWRTARSPRAMERGPWQAGRTGATLDPIMALGQELQLPPHSSRQVAFLTLVAPTRQAVLSLVEQFRPWNAIERIHDQARAAAEVELLRLGLSGQPHTNQVHSIQHLLSALIYPHAALRAPVETLRANRKGQPGLWPYAISGDCPILLVSLGGVDELPLLQDLLQAHAYWRNRNLRIDLVIVNEQGQNYGQELAAQIRGLVERSGAADWLNRRGGVFILLADQITPDDRTLLETVAAVVLHGSQGDLDRQLPGGERSPVRLPTFVPTPGEPVESDQDRSVAPQPALRPDLSFANGWGGFSLNDSNGSAGLGEYIMDLDPSRPTPAPWINVIANPEFGCLVSEGGLGYTWSLNSGENRLTPWSNDPISDPPGEALYMRDEETAEVWSPTPYPSPAPARYEVRHGPGYTLFSHQSHGLQQQLRVFVPTDAPVKCMHLRIENFWPRVRRITVSYYAEWVLGVNRESTQTTLIPEYDGEAQALLATNPYNVEFGSRVAFAAASKGLHGLTADRTEFLGRLGDRSRPAALGRVGLAGTVQPGLDPCAALQIHLDLQPGEAQEVTFLLGQGSDRADALAWVRRFQDPAQVSTAWEAVKARWEGILGAVQVSTPDPGLDVLLNQWLLNQSIAGRLWGRSAFYQSSGAYGFRDQLQDVMGLVYAAPELAREHLLRAAAHQFDAGDVLHWWHPPSGRGVRTHFSDDLLWLPYVTAFYVRTTGDQAVLNEVIPFLTGLQLEPGEDEHYGLYSPQSGPGATLWEHCLRAIDRGATTGAHGLPLMGSGDWNDGMNRVGIEGRGESIWLGWFLIAVLQDFAGLCDLRGEAGQAERLRSRAAGYTRAIEENAWDGDWYLRAFYDDGSPLGSARNRECQIDAIAQSWAVLSGAGDPERVRQAMESVWKRLVRPAEELILLFTPPFDKTPRDPGYIKGYVPGVRENGGQYTHAAIWTVWAYACLGQGERVGELFRLLNPISHSDSPGKAARYKVEPYVIAADVYSVPPHTGRGGWTWYTGSASWMYRLGLEAILGLRLEGDRLWLDPCIPPDWTEYKIHFRHAGSVYHIEVQNPHRVSRGVCTILVDGAPAPGRYIPLDRAAGEHSVVVEMGAEDAG